MRPIPQSQTCIQAVTNLLSAKIEILKTGKTIKLEKSKTPLEKM